MKKMTRHELAFSAATDVANRQMRKDQRERWSREDYNAAVAEYHRLNPCEKTMKTLDEKLEGIADTVERLVRERLKPSDESYHRVYVKALVRSLQRRSGRKA